MTREQALRLASICINQTMSSERLVHDVLADAFLSVDAEARKEERQKIEAMYER